MLKLIKESNELCDKIKRDISNNDISLELQGDMIVVNNELKIDSHNKYSDILNSITEYINSIKSKLYEDDNKELLEESRAPKVGPFYVIDGAVFSDYDEIRDITPINGKSDSDNNHYDYYKLLRQFMPELKEYDYDYYPRGRVIYDTKNDTYNIFIDKCINKNDIIEEIISEYYLPKDKVKITDNDEHYKCHLCNDNYSIITESN